MTENCQVEEKCLIIKEKSERKKNHVVLKFQFNPCKCTETN